MKLEGSCVLITGGTRGLGRQFSLDLARRGARVGVCSTDEERLEIQRREFERSGLPVWTHRADVSAPAQVEAMFGKFVDDHGRVDALVNNAGVTRDCLLVKPGLDGSVQRMPYEKWARVIDVNLTGVFLCGREAAWHMVQAKTGGVIVNISSVCREGNVGQTSYSAAKAGVVAMTVAWAKELARYGIRVVSLAPGYVATQMTKALRPDVRQRIEAAIPAGRMASCEEISDALQFALSNDYLSGRVLSVDGGLRI